MNSVLKRRRGKLCTILVLATAVFAGTGGGSAAEKRAITEKDILKFNWVADPEISPDGKQVAYVLVTVNEKEDGYETSLWSVNTAGTPTPRRLTAGPRDSAPRWSPDSNTVAFLRAGEKDPAQIYLLSMQGGEGMKWTDLPRGGSAAVWSPDGRAIAFTSDTTAEDLAEKREKKAAENKDIKKDDKKGDDKEKKKSDVRVITRAVFRANGEGWLELGRHDHIWTVSVPPGSAAPPEPTQITAGKYDEGEIAWSRDGAKIYFVSQRVDEPYYLAPDTNLYAVAAKGAASGEAMTTMIDIDGPIDGAVASPDGARFAFLGFINPSQDQSNTQTSLFVFANGKAANLTSQADVEIGTNVSGDQHAPRGGGASSPVIWTPDGRTVIVAATVEGRSNLVRVDAATGKMEPLTSGNHEVMAYTASPDGSKIAATIGDATHIGDVYLLDTATKKLTQLTHVNDALFDTLNLSEPEEFTYSSFDGKKIQGWIQKPPDFTAGKKYPLILEIHGGPHAAYGHTFMHEFHWLAAKGYMVVYVNPRGSTSYGQDFSNIIQYRYPGDDFKDLMAGVDEVLKRGYVDAARMGVTGGSGGGLLTNWTVTQTPRFRAAVSQRSVADWAAFWYTADFTLFRPTWFRKNPYQDPEEFSARSPVRYAEKITTPMMFIEGDADYRTPPVQGGEAMFRALKAQKKVAVMVRFPGESHELSRSGKPQHRIERLEHIEAWFGKYLQGRDVKTYDLQ
jgi:dipeptidyl aminopeptidase/acylaminoacyl peptidase